VERTYFSDVFAAFTALLENCTTGTAEYTV